MHTYGSRASAIVLAELLSVVLPLSEKEVTEHKHVFSFLSQFFNSLLDQMDAQFVVQTVRYST